MKEIKLDINGKEYTVKINEFGSKEATLEVNGKKYIVGLKDLGKELNLGSVQEALTPLATSDPIVSAPKTNVASTGGSGEVLSPLPGLILNVIVNVGDKVKLSVDFKNTKFYNDLSNNVFIVDEVTKSKWEYFPCDQYIGLAGIPCLYLNTILEKK